MPLHFSTCADNGKSPDMVGKERLELNEAHHVDHV
jgi:hypothetical protein